MTHPLCACIKVVSVLKTLGEHGDDLVEVADDAEVCHAEYRCKLVLVDCDDELGLFHACEVLYRAGDAEGEVYVGTYGLACLAYLTLVPDDAGIDHCA